MSDEFDDLLRRLADSAAASAMPLAPPEVRRRGNARRTRRTVAATMVSALAIASLGTAVLRGAEDGPAGTEVAAPHSSTASVSPGLTPEPKRVPGPNPGGGTATVTITPPPVSFSAEPMSSAPTGPPSGPEPVPDPLGPGAVPRLTPPAPGDSVAEVTARAEMLTLAELPRDGFAEWASASRTSPVNCAPYAIPGFGSVVREDRYSQDGGGGFAWQEVLLPSSVPDAEALYEQRRAGAAACSPSNSKAVEILTGVDQGVIYSYGLDCRPGKPVCGDIAFVVGVARIADVVVYVQFSHSQEFDVPQSRAAIRTFLTRIGTSSLTS